MTALELVDMTIVELQRLRHKWETQEPYQLDPNQWRCLGREFWRRTMLLNADKCNRLANHFEQVK
jgi:hypothetical protein